jgi:hypothetical protein
MFLGHTSTDISKISVVPLPTPSIYGTATWGLSRDSYAVFTKVKEELLDFWENGCEVS